MKWIFLTSLSFVLVSYNFLQGAASEHPFLLHRFPLGNKPTIVRSTSTYQSIPVSVDTSEQPLTSTSQLPMPSVGTATAAQVAIYPNPSNGFFKVHCPEGIQELRIINILGQELLHLENLGHQAQEIKLDGEEFEGFHSLYIRDMAGREIMEQLSIY